MHVFYNKKHVNGFNINSKPEIWKWNHFTPVQTFYGENPEIRWREFHNVLAFQLNPGSRLSLVPIVQSVTNSMCNSCDESSVINQYTVYNRVTQSWPYWTLTSSDLLPLWMVWKITLNSIWIQMHQVVHLPHILYTRLQMKILLFCHLIQL